LEDSVVKTAVISIVERDSEIEKMENEIEKIQELLDQHNATTEI
jgi:hypothetical protein